MKILKKGTKLNSILRYKCPYCQNGDFFKNNNPFNFKTVGVVKEKCASCNNKLSIEPGFYFGALYVSYALGVAVFVGVFLLVYLFYPNPSAGIYLTFVLASVVVFSPVLYQLSKIIWANFFIKYKKDESL